MSLCNEVMSSEFLKCTYPISCVSSNKKVLRMNSQKTEGIYWNVFNWCRPFELHLYSSIAFTLHGFAGPNSSDGKFSWMWNMPRGVQDGKSRKWPKNVWYCVLIASDNTHQNSDFRISNWAKSRVSGVSPLKQWRSQYKFAKFHQLCNASFAVKFSATRLTCPNMWFRIMLFLNFDFDGATTYHKHWSVVKRVMMPRKVRSIFKFHHVPFQTSNCSCRSSIQERHGHHDPRSTTSFPSRCSSNGQPTWGAFECWIELPNGNFVTELTQPFIHLNPLLLYSME